MSPLFLSRFSHLRDESPSPSGPELDAAVDALWANLLFREPEEPHRSLAVTSALPHEGKSTVAALLARAMARSGARVVLVDADLRHRSLARALGAHPRLSWCEALAGGGPVSSALCPAGEGLWLLDGASQVADPTPLVCSRAFARMVASLSRAFDRVVVDTPPLLPFVDGAAAAAACESALLVVRRGHCSPSELSRARSQLGLAGSPVAGAVMTFCGEGARRRGR